MIEYLLIMIKIWYLERFIMEIISSFKEYPKIWSQDKLSWIESEPENKNLILVNIIILK